MTSISKLKVFSSETCLISTLASQLIALDRRDLQDHLVILPTQRLATHLSGILARKWGALIPPTFLSMEALIKRGACQSSPRIISDAALDFLVQRKLAEQEWNFLRPGQERELRLILGELYENKQRDQAFALIKRHIEEDIYRDPNYLDSILGRVLEIETILNETEASIKEKQLWTKAEAMAEAANNFSPTSVGLEQFNDIYLVGFTSMSPSWMPAVEELCKLDSLEVWLSDKPNIFHQSSPLSELIGTFRGICEELPVESSHVTEKKPVHLVEVDSPFGEVAKALELIHQLIAEGHEPSQLGVLLTNEGLYGPILSCLKDDVLEKGNLALTRPFLQCRQGRWLEKTIKVLEQQDLQHWVDWMSDPHTLAWITEHHDFNLESFIWNLAKSNAASLPQFLGTSPEGQELLDHLMDLSKDFPSGQKRLDDWVQSTFTWIQRCEVKEDRSSGEAQSIADTLKQFLRTAEQACELHTGLISRREYFDFLRLHLLEADIRDTGEPLSGVQFLSLAESRYYPFSAVIILGCNEGTFPKALPKDELLDNLLKKQMGLPGWESLESMEDQTFHLLKERLPQLYLFRSKVVDEQETVTSRFIEKLQTEETMTSSSLKFEPNSFWAGLGQAFTSHDYQTNSEGVSPEHPDRLWNRVSASSLEKLLRCPYRFMLHKLQVKPVEFAKVDDPRREGEWLHQILESFFTGCIDEDTIFQWQSQDFEDFTSIALERLKILTHIIGPDNFEGKPLYFHLLQHSWPRFIDHISRFYGESFIDFSKGLREAKLDSFASPAKIKIRDILRNCQGSIDSIDRSYGLTMITDYKRRTSPARRESQQGVLTQLPFYSLAIMGLEKDFNLEQMLIGYWNIIKGEWTTHGVGESAKERAVSKGLANSRSPDIRSITETAIKTWTWRESSVLEEGRFYADPSSCTLCDYQDICRKSDPRHQELIESQTKLNDYLVEEFS